jgi:hypothetical protein
MRYVEKMFPVGFRLADLTALHWVVVVGDGEPLVAVQHVFMIEQPLDGIE